MRVFRIATLCSLFMFLVPIVVSADTDSTRAALQAQLAQVQAQILDNQSKLADQQKQQASLERDEAVLDSQIKEAQLEMHQRDLQIAQLNDSIGENQDTVTQLDGSVRSGQESLGQIIRNMQEIDGRTPAQVALSGTFVDIFRERDDYDSIQRALGEAFTKMSDQRDTLTQKIADLQDKQQEQSDLLLLQKQQQTSLVTSQKQKQDLITQTKGQESAYRKLINTQLQTAAQIEQALFALASANKSVSFGDMYSYAKQAGALTGVRPAVILGILTEESNLGQNVGTGNWKTDMHPTRDAPIFQQICSALGLDPDTQPVSKKAWYGWGGAMGPGQFIPSTWQMYADRIAKATGQNPPNPWDPKTATFATALLMADNGADAGTRDAERLAALRYLAGRKNATNPSYAFYGNQVMGFADKYQAQIDLINANGGGM